MMKLLKKLFRPTIVVDVNALPSNYKTQQGGYDPALFLNYCEDYCIHGIPVDGSPQNTKGMNNNNNLVRKL